jgi:hypothetical protein
MSLFFDTVNHGEMSDEELGEFERQAGIRLLEYMRGIAKKADSILSPEAKSWFKVDLSPPADWFDPEYPHLVLGEIHRMFCKLPEYYPAWMSFTDEEMEAVAVLLALRKAVRATRGIDPQKALQLLNSGVVLGHTVTKAHVMPREESARKYSGTQSEKGKKGAAARWESNGAQVKVKQIIESLAPRRDWLGDFEPPNELWPVLFSEMDAASLNPVEAEAEAEDPTYEYAANQKIKYSAFRRRLQRLRKEI